MRKAILAEFGLPDCIVPHERIAALCQERGAKFAEKFNELANGQTCTAEGMYPWDVADILRTIQTGIEKTDWD